MGLFDKIKKAATVAAAPPLPPVPSAAPPPAPVAAAAPPPAPTGPSFSHRGTTLPLPPGWDGLSVEDWFYKMELLRDRMMDASEEALAPMTNASGDPLDPEEVILVLEGFEDGGHYEKFRNWGAANWAQRLGTDQTNLEFRMSSIAREKLMASKASAISGAGGALEPVEGVSCEQWAHINAALANGGGANFDQLLANASMDRPKWDRVNAEWLARMTTDTTMAIAVVYGNAFANSGQGQFSAQAGHAANVGVGGDLSDEPVSFERYCEIEAAMAAASDRGEDVNQLLLGSFAMSIIDWSQISMFWAKKSLQDASGYHELYIELSAKYKAQYAG